MIPIIIILKGIKMKKIFIIAFLAIFSILNANNLKIVGPLEIKGLEPNKAGYIFSRLQIGENLITIDEKGQLKPALATNWQASKDGLTWTFKIREDVKFHDDTNLDANIRLHTHQLEQLKKNQQLNQ